MTHEMERLPGCDYAFYNPCHGRQRIFFVLNPAPEIVERLKQFKKLWQRSGTLSERK